MNNKRLPDTSFMTPQQLRMTIRILPERPRITTTLEQALRKRANKKKVVWYSSQKEHWLGWLKEYDGPGFYGRQDSNRTAEFVYNHINCPPMVLWLGEACGLPKALVVEAKTEALAAKPSRASQCAAIRNLIPWSKIEKKLGRKARD